MFLNTMNLHVSMYSCEHFPYKGKHFDYDEHYKKYNPFRKDQDEKEKAKIFVLVK